MKFDFTTVLDRRGKDSTAAEVIPFANAHVKEGFDPIPMWVADMSFPVAPSVEAAIKKRMEMPNYGYFQMPDCYYESIISWQERRNHVTGLEKGHIGYENGVLGGVSSAVQVLSCPGEPILIHSPTYVGFTECLKNIGRPIVHSPLKRDENGIWRMDYEDMDAKIKKNHVRLAIFCSPHNPCGRVWERWEIERAMEVYAKNGCAVISDEIWSDIIMPGYRHIPTQSISEDAKNRTIAFYSPSKTFSLAGLIGSYHIIYNDYLRQRVQRHSSMSHYNSCNVLSLHALLGAFSPEGEEWAEEMLTVIDENIEYACTFIKENFKGVSCMRPQGTYMLYLDCSDYLRTHNIDIMSLLLKGVEYGVIWQNGEAFQWPNSIRMNLALPKTRLIEAYDRLKKYVFL